MKAAASLLRTGSVPVHSSSSKHSCFIFCKTSYPSYGRRFRGISRTSSESHRLWSFKGMSMEELGLWGYSKSDRNKIGEYYKQLLKENPGDSLMLRNYGKFLHEVEGDRERAEECYGRAILSNPEDGELLSLYGKLMWETQRDERRAKCYFEQAVCASPNDCMVLGSYAQFMWEAENDDDDDDDDDDDRDDVDGKVETELATSTSTFAVL